MFEVDGKKKEMKENLLEKLIDHLMSMPEGSDAEEALESPEEEKSEDGEIKPKVEMKVMEVKTKPKFMGPEGVEMEDESIEDILKRKKQKA